MPDQAAEAIGRVADSVERLATASHQLHEDVGVLGRRQRWQTWLLGLMSFAVVLLIIGTIVDYFERQDAAEARGRIERVTAEIDRATDPANAERRTRIVADAVSTINTTNLAIALCQREQAPNLEQCVAARVTKP